MKQTIWFERTDWFWQPICPKGWLVMASTGLAAMLFNAWLLTQMMDIGSLLYNLMLSNAVALLWFDWLARRHSYRDGRPLQRRQRDPESWT